MFYDVIISNIYSIGIQVYNSTNKSNLLKDTDN